MASICLGLDVLKFDIVIIAIICHIYSFPLDGGSVKHIQFKLALNELFRVKICI